MKLFQQLLVAPAALGLLASGANADSSTSMAFLTMRLLPTKSPALPKSPTFTQLTGPIRRSATGLISTAASLATPTAPSVATGR